MIRGKEEKGSPKKGEGKCKKCSLENGSKAQNFIRSPLSGTPPPLNTNEIPPNKSVNFLKERGPKISKFSPSAHIRIAAYPQYNEITSIDQFS